MAKNVVSVVDGCTTVVIPSGQRALVLAAIRDILMTDVELHGDEPDKRAWTGLMAIIADWHNRSKTTTEMRIIRGAYEIVPRARE